MKEEDLNCYNSDKAVKHVIIVAAYEIYAYKLEHKTGKV